MVITEYSFPFFHVLKTQQSGKVWKMINIITEEINL